MRPISRLIGATLCAAVASFATAAQTCPAQSITGPTTAT